MLGSPTPPGNTPAKIAPRYHGRLSRHQQKQSCEGGNPRSKIWGRAGTRGQLLSQQCLDLREGICCKAQPNVGIFILTRSSLDKMLPSNVEPLALFCKGHLNFQTLAGKQHAIVLKWPSTEAPPTPVLTAQAVLWLRGPCRCWAGRAAPPGGTLRMLLQLMASYRPHGRESKHMMLLMASYRLHGRKSQTQ